HALRGARGADAGEAGRARVAAARVVLVDRAVAVVVETVAHFRGRELLLHAVEHAVLADRGAGRAHAEKTGVARVAAARVAFIDEPVAVVVASVARFGGGLLERVAHGMSGGASAGAERADTGAAGVARGAEAGDVFVDHAVAVVVDAVANFSGRRA